MTLLIPLDGKSDVICPCVTIYALPRIVLEIYRSLSQAFLKTPTSLSPSCSSFILCSTKLLRSAQNSSVATTSFPLGPTAAAPPAAPVFAAASTPASPLSLSLGAAAAGLAAGLSLGVVTAAAPPITMTPNSTSGPASAPTTSDTSFESVTGFFLYRILILAAGMLVAAAYCDLSS